VTGRRKPDRKKRSAVFAPLDEDAKNGTTDTGFAFGTLIFLTRVLAPDKKPASFGKRAFRFT